jgi:hypothetical protein
MHGSEISKDYFFGNSKDFYLTTKILDEKNLKEIKDKHRRRSSFFSTDWQL